MITTITKKDFNVLKKLGVDSINDTKFLKLVEKDMNMEFHFQSIHDWNYWGGLFDDDILEIGFIDDGYEELNDVGRELYQIYDKLVANKS